MIYIHNAILYTPSEKLDYGAIIITGDTITALGSERDLPCPPNTPQFDACGQYLVPGFIDLQINGAYGMDFTSDPESIWLVGEQLIHFGVTSFLPTIISSPPETTVKAQEVVRKGPPVGYHGARVIGLHLEGPFLNPEKHGAHNPDYLRLPVPEIYDHWSPATCVRMVTLAPELPGAITAVRTLVKHGVVVSAGHSQANLLQSQVGFEAGIRYGTHLFNAMPAFNHRQPGLVGALLADQRLTSGMIADGIHIHPVTINIAWKALGTLRTSLVTDAMAALGNPPGEYQLGGQQVFVDGTSAKLEDGTLAGSLISLGQAVRNLIEFSGCSLEEALPSITQVPARLLGLNSSLGNLVVGAKADLVLLNQDVHVAAVWLNGRQILPVPE
jgi:N-acetylglucosamine-6-phosphate deacetylase